MKLVVQTSRQQVVLYLIPDSRPESKAYLVLYCATTRILMRIRVFFFLWLPLSSGHLYSRTVFFSTRFT